MELGQVLHNNPVGIACPTYVTALVEHIKKELERVYWNINQQEWDQRSDPKLPGIEWRGYYNWGGCPEDPDWDQQEADKPNFRFGDVEVRWYKNFGRSMNVNVSKTPEEWVAWFDECIDHIYQQEDAFRRRRR